MRLFDKRFGATAEQRTRRALATLAVVLGFLQAWASRMDLVSDTVSYLDMGDGIWRGHWSMAVNGLWGPLYATILGIAVGVVKPTLYWEYPLVHLVVYAIFLFALFTFDFFLKELIRARQQNESSAELAVPAWAWVMLGYSLFLWASLQLVQVSETNPDMLVAAFFFLACGFLIKIHRGGARWGAYVGLGAALGFGYLTKSIMFPVSLMCLACAFVKGRKQIGRVVAAVVVFSAIAGPSIVALSAQRGRLTFGESGHYNYAVHVNHVPRTHWQGETPGAGKPIHGSRQIFGWPATFEFATPLVGTYPAWTDPSYWYEGVQTPLNLRRVFAREAELLQVELLFLFELHGAIVAVVFLLFFVSARKWMLLKDVAALWFLLIPAGGALVLYAMIHLEPRYLAPFFVVLLMSLFVSVHLPPSQESRRICAACAIFLFLMFILPVESSSLHVRQFERDVLRRSKSDPNSFQAVASEIQRLGLKPGDRIASLEYSLWGMSTWARLARAQIVAEVYYWPDQSEGAENDFWKADAATQQGVIEAIRKTGARVIVSEFAPKPENSAGWQRIGQSQYYAYWLTPGSGSAAANDVAGAAGNARTDR